MRVYYRMGGLVHGYLFETCQQESIVDAKPISFVRYLLCREDVGAKPREFGDRFDEIEYA